MPVTGDNDLAIPAGSKINGVVEQAKQGGHLGGHGELQLDYKSIVVSGEQYSLQATLSGAGGTAVNQQGGTATSSGASTGKDTAAGTAGGAILGGILGGGKGLLMGGAAGAGVGLAAGVLTAGRDVTLPPGSAIILRLDTPLTVTAH